MLRRAIYDYAASSTSKRTTSKPAAWLVPANPSYYDIGQAFRQSDETIWKQSTNINIGDTVYLYIAAPVSAVIYKCLVTDVDIPYDYRDKNVSMDHVMKIKKLEQYPADFLTADRLKEYGVNAVRGPRHMPADLVHMLNSLSK